jgi:hypothetical protein
MRVAYRTLAVMVCGAITMCLLMSAAFGQDKPAKKADRSQWDRTKRPILFDNEKPPAGYPVMNPYNILIQMTSGGQPILDHAGQPHTDGHVIQVIQDGGNGVQDPPRADGSPGGDDTLAYGNFNMIRMSGDPLTGNDGQNTGTFISKRNFIPYVQPGPAYYLRIWEGDDIATAPYYQDTKEYSAGRDQGGATFTPKPAKPTILRWKFGEAVARPQAK